MHNSNLSQDDLTPFRYIKYMNDQHTNRMNRVCDYIATNLDGNLSVEKLSNIANFSMYHFHRSFAAYMGVNVTYYIQMVRFKRASYQLAFHKEMKIIDIALAANFENPESFSRAFKKIFEQTPSSFREHPNWITWHNKYNFNKITGETNMDVDIIELETIKVAALEHHGAPELLNNTITNFIAWRKESKLSPVKTNRTFGLVYNDPNTTAAEDFKFDVCGEVVQDVPENPQNVITKEIPKGRYAVTRHTGSHDHMDEKIYNLYREWLPKSGEQVRDFPLFFEYYNFFPEVKESELITDIYLPIK